MKRKILISFLSLIIGCAITDAQILNSVSHSRITHKEERPFKYFFYGEVQSGYWQDTSNYSNAIIGLSLGFKHCMKNSNFFAGAKLDYARHIEGESSFSIFIEPTISYIRKANSITEKTIDFSLGCGAGYFEHGAIMPNINFTYWFSRVGIGGTARFIIPMVYQTTANYNLMGYIAIRF